MRICQTQLMECQYPIGIPVEDVNVRHMGTGPVHQLIRTTCAITKAKKRRTPITAIDPEERNLSSEFAPSELMRLEFDGRIVFADTFLGIILGGINQINNC